MLNQLPTLPPMILMAAGNSVVNSNIEGAKNNVVNVLDKLNQMVTDPGASALGTTWEYLEITPTEALVLTKIMEVLKPIAFGLIVIFFVSNLIQQYMAFNNQIPMLILVKSAAFVIVAVVALDYMFNIVSIFVNLSNSFAQTIKTGLDGALTTAEVAQSGSGGDWAETMQQAKDTILSDAQWTQAKNVLMSVMFWVISGLTSLITALADLIKSIVLYSTKLEMLIRWAFAPIALASLGSESHKHEALRYFRKCLAASLTCGAAMILMYIASILPAATAMKAIRELANPTVGDVVAGVATGGTTAALSLADNMALIGNAALMSIIMPFSAIGAISAVKSTINEALGA